MKKPVDIGQGGESHDHDHDQDLVRLVQRLLNTIKTQGPGAARGGLLRQVRIK
jgi:hypothetical protein